MALINLPVESGLSAENGFSVYSTNGYVSDGNSFTCMSIGTLSVATFRVDISDVDSMNEMIGASWSGYKFCYFLMSDSPFEYWFYEKNNGVYNKRHFNSIIGTINGDSYHFGYLQYHGNSNITVYGIYDSVAYTVRDGIIVSGVKPINKYYPITYRLTNCTAPDAPSEASIGSTVTVPFVFPDGYGIVNNENVYVTNNGVIVPSTYSGGVLTFEMPDPN